MSGLTRQMSNGFFCNAFAQQETATKPPGRARSQLHSEMPKSSFPGRRKGQRAPLSFLVKCKHQRRVFVDLLPRLPVCAGKQMLPTKQQKIEMQFFSLLETAHREQKVTWFKQLPRPRAGQCGADGLEAPGNERKRRSTVKPVIRLRRAVRTVISLLKTFNRKDSEEKKKDESKTWSDLESEVRASQRVYQTFGLTWDPLIFHINKELNICNEAKAILTMRPDMRTPEQLHVALLSMCQTVPAFSEYPKTMQMSLVKAGWYEFIEAKRTIIKQGHVPFNFYLIISGAALVTAKEEDEAGKPSHRTVAILKKGMSFGELCLFSGCRRTVTVTSKDNMEVLSIARDDYIDIFRQNARDGKEPEHLTFLRSIRLLDGWPVSSLPLDDPSVCAYTYVRRGTLICSDAEDGEWIYIIKSGSCHVLKELTAVRPSWPSVDNGWDPGLDIGLGKSARRTPKSVTDAWDLPSAPPARHLSRVLPLRKERSAIELTSYPASAMRQHTFHHLPRNRVTGFLHVGMSRTDEEMRLESDKHLRQLGSIFNTRNRLQSSLTGCRQRNREAAEPRERGPPKKPPAEDDRCFVQVLTLRSKDIYGLDPVVFPAFPKLSTRTSLVSNGAECILISKKFFLKNLTDDCFRKIQMEIRPLPSDDALQEKLQTKIDWESYRAMTVSDLISCKKPLIDSLQY